MRLFSPCKKCLVSACCKQYDTCEKYQNWLFNKWFCKHDPYYLHGIPFECRKCHKILNMLTDIYLPPSGRKLK